jgi:hypothetical protein
MEQVRCGLTAPKAAQFFYELLEQERAAPAAVTLNFDETCFHGYTSDLKSTNVFVVKDRRNEAFTNSSNVRDHVTLLSTIDIEDMALVYMLDHAEKRPEGYDFTTSTVGGVMRSPKPPPRPERPSATDCTTLSEVRLSSRTLWLTLPRCVYQEGGPVTSNSQRLPRSSASTSSATQSHAVVWERHFTVRCLGYGHGPRSNSVCTRIIFGRRQRSESIVQGIIAIAINKCMPNVLAKIESL